MMSKYRIVLCEIYNENIHGKTEYDDPMINSHYLIIGKFDNYYDHYYSDNEDNNDQDEDSISEQSYDYDSDNVPIEEIMELHTAKYMSQFVRNNVRYKHPFIRNYRNIVLNPAYIQPEIAECFMLSSGESVAILKTFWIRIIQRSWRRVLHQKQIILEKRSTSSELFYRQMRGKWSCSMPGLYGMLYNTSF